MKTPVPPPPDDLRRVASDSWARNRDGSMHLARTSQPLEDAVRRQADAPPAERFAAMVRAGAIDPEGNVLLRGPEPPAEGPAPLCATCRHWAPARDYQVPGPGEFRECHAIACGSPPGAAARIVTWQSHGRPTLATRADFGCTLHEPGEEDRP